MSTITRILRKGSESPRFPPCCCFDVVNSCANSAGCRTKKHSNARYRTQHRRKPARLEASTKRFIPMHPLKARKEPKPSRSDSGYDLRPLTSAERDAAAKPLAAEERYVILNHGTERAFCGTLLNNKQSGMYACRLCGLPLFRANAKFESGTGWPSFYQPFDKDHVAEILDESHGMIRVEIRCHRCDGH